MWYNTVWELQGCEDDFRRLDQQAATGLAAIVSIRDQIVKQLAHLPQRPEIAFRINAFQFREVVDAGGLIGIFAARHPRVLSEVAPS